LLGVSALDPVAFGGAAALLVVVGLASRYGPAGGRRASIALRTDCLPLPAVS
jgi:hypothetical protein